MAHEMFMREALAQARRAERRGEVPVGAVVVRDGAIVARGYNQRESRGDPTAHAEILAIRKAARRLGNWRLEDCTLYVTLEPCPMCAGAAVLARLKTLVFATPDPKGGACGSLMNLLDDDRLNHRVEIVSGILKEEAARVLRDFFLRLRESRPIR